MTERISIHALREEGDLFRHGQTGQNLISIHALREEGDGVSVGYRIDTIISIHALREEGDDSPVLQAASSFQFLSTPSARRATSHRRWHDLRRGHFYPRPPRGGRRHRLRGPHQHPEISIHALREEGDGPRTAFQLSAEKFLSTPSARRATCGAGVGYTTGEFLSTPSARRATKGGYCTAVAQLISIHALREEGDEDDPWGHSGRRPISIHALREEGDTFVDKEFSAVWIFLSTPSARRATADGERPRIYCQPISIHALREEGDSKNGEKHLRFCFIIKRSAQIWKSLSKNIRKNSCDLHRTA